jgi:SAM-dependent methyltransferase
MRVARETPAGPAQTEAIARALARIEAPEPLAAWYANYARWHRGRFAQDLRLIDDFAPEAHDIAEFGTVPPILTAALAERPVALTGIDIAPERFGPSLERLGARIVKCDIERERLPFPDASFDLLVFNEIFEHLRIDLLFTFAELRRVLRPGGIILLSTPNLRSLRGIRAFLRDGRSAWCGPDLRAEWAKIATLGHMGHVREYTARDITDFLDASGFAPEALIWRGGTAGRLDGALCALWPQLLPFMTVVARRTAET